MSDSKTSRAVVCRTLWASPWRRCLCAMTGCASRCVPTSSQYKFCASSTGGDIQYQDGVLFDPVTRRETGSIHLLYPRAAYCGVDDSEERSSQVHKFAVCVHAAGVLWWGGQSGLD